MLIPAKNHKGIELASSFSQYHSKPNSLSKSHPGLGGGGGGVFAGRGSFMNSIPQYCI